MKRWMGMAVLVLVSGCGAETVGTAAIQASMKAQEAEQAKQIQRDVQQQMEAVHQLQQQRLEEAARAADQASQ
jgi:NifU-like protein involved in Fe-S cluster formation